MLLVSYRYERRKPLFSIFSQRDIQQRSRSDDVISSIGSEALQGCSRARAALDLVKDDQRFLRRGARVGIDLHLLYQPVCFEAAIEDFPDAFIVAKVQVYAVLVGLCKLADYERLPDLALPSHEQAFVARPHLPFQELIHCLATEHDWFHTFQVFLFCRFFIDKINKIADISDEKSVQMQIFQINNL